MTATPLSERLRGRTEPAGYVSFLSALIHHGALVDALAVIQVASAERAGRDASTRPGPVEFLPVPRDGLHGYRLEAFEGDVVPVASPEKALVDWIYWAEERGLDTRLDEIEWDAIDRETFFRLAAEAGVDPRPFLVEAARPRASAHDQARFRAAAVPAPPSAPA